MLQAVWQSLLQSTLNTKDMTIHTDISEIIGQCRHDLTLERSFYPRRYSINFYTRRLLPAVQPLTLLYTIFHEKGTPFGRGFPAAVPVQAITGSTPRVFQMTSLLYIPAHTSRPFHCHFHFIVFVGKTIRSLKKKRKENHHRNNLFEILKLKKQYG